VERRPAVIRFAALLLAVLICVPVRAQERVLLVAAADSPLQSLSSFEVRKVYLGISVFKDGHSVHALRNDTDQRLNEVFLQSVVGLSEESYERRLLTNTFKFGTARPERISKSTDMAPVLRADPYAVTYIWGADVVPPGFKVLRVLWQDY
jgi:hypothetical protein